MLPLIHRVAVLLACTPVAFAIAAEGDKGGTTRTAQDDRVCAGVSNETTKMRELRREMGAYFGQAIPEELQLRVRKHIDMVAKLKAECDQQREQSAQVK